MANLVYKRVDVPQGNDFALFEFRQADDTLAASGDTVAQGLVVSNFKEFSVQAYDGTRGSMAVAWHGTLDENELGYSALTDAAGTAISLTATEVKEVLQVTYKIKPVISGAGGSSVRIRIFCRN